MMLGPITTEHTPYGWLDFATITCDLCELGYRDGRAVEYPATMQEAHDDGWQLDSATGLVCCPGCHLRMVNGQGAATHE